MKAALVVPVFSVLLLAAGLSPPSRAAERRPNVIVILTDDQGAADAHCYGAQDLQTPAMDGIAARGVRFTQFYSAAPVCSPSRAGLLTGRYPLRAGLVGNASCRKGDPGMPPQATLAKMFKAAGYATAHIGKWHLGFTPETMPNSQGFDYSFGHMGGCIDNFSHFFYWEGPNRHDLYRNGQEVYYPGRFFPDLMIEEAQPLPGGEPRVGRSSSTSLSTCRTIRIRRSRNGWSITRTCPTRETCMRPSSRRSMTGWGRC